MERFETFGNAAVDDIAGSLDIHAPNGPAARHDVQRVLASLAPHAPALLAAAKSGHAPITHIDSVVSDLLDVERQRCALSARQTLDILTAGIAHILARSGYLPVRAEPCAFGEMAEPGFRFFFLRRTELSLFDVLDEGQAVTLAATLDARRFGRAVISRYAQGQDVPARRVFLWTIASGLSEVVVEEGRLDFLPAGAEALYRPETTISTLSQTCMERDTSPGMAAFELIMHGYSGGQLASNDSEDTGIGDVRFFFRADALEGRQARLDVVLDDTGVDGDPTEVPDEVVALVRRRLEETVVSDQAKRDRWPRINAKGESEDPMHMPGLIDFVMQRQPEGALFVLYDGEVFLGDEASRTANVAAAFLRDACARLWRSGRGTQILVLSAPLTVPAALGGQVTHLALALPNKLELLAEIRRRCAGLDDLAPEDEGGAHPLQPTDGLLNVVDAAAGMTLSDTAHAIRTAVHAGARHADELVQAINRLKRAALKRSAALELLDREPPRELMLGGMERFWDWLAIRHRAFKHPELAGHFGIDRRPKGVLILGIPGTGKSLAAKVIAREWQTPLVRLDMGALQNRYVGASEERIREALQIVEAMSPCVLWIDEIDKGVAQGDNTSTHSTDLNIRATLLTWLQENDSAVFVVATANRFASLPPELTRAGRFDARFFFGCPDAAGCRQILDIHLDMRRISHVTSEERDMIAVSMHGFTGAEIEQSVLDGLYHAFAKDRPPESDDFLQAARCVKPLIRAAGRSLEEVWALIEQGRVELASKHFLTRVDVARLIDPESFSPMYCRLDGIHGWDKHAARAARLLMRDQFGMPAAVVLGTGDTDWVYVQTNFKLEAEDPAPFKFLDELSEVENNGVIDRLVVECGLQILWFENDVLRQRFMASTVLAAYEELFKVLA